MLQSLLWQCQQRKGVLESEPFDWEEKEGNELDTGVVSTTAGIQTTAEYVLLCSLLCSQLLWCSGALFQSINVSVFWATNKLVD